MVEHPQRVDTRRTGVWTLLPVEPPEIDAFVLEGVVKDFKVGIEELFVGAIKGDWLGWSAVSCHG